MMEKGWKKRRGRKVWSHQEKSLCGLILSVSVLDQSGTSKQLSHGVLVSAKHHVVYVAQHATWRDLSAFVNLR